MKKIVVLFDVDNTLLDNDRVTMDLSKYLEKEVGPDRKNRYWARPLVRHGALLNQI